MSATQVQITIDCANPALLVEFWATALHYVAEPPPEGFDTWREYWRFVGVPDEEFGPDGTGADSVVDPEGVGPRIWFQVVPEGKVVKNRVHLDLKLSGGRTVALELRRERVDAEVARLVAAGATIVRVLATEGLDHYGVTLADPEGNEFCVA
jgi:hypothetical protein